MQYIIFMKTFSESAFIKSILKSADNRLILQTINFVDFSLKCASNIFFQLFSKRLHSFSGFLKKAFGGFRFFALKKVWRVYKQ